MKEYANQFLSNVLDLVFPAVCKICNKPQEPPVCDSCAKGILTLPQGECSKCGIEGSYNCKHCRWMLHLDWLRSAVQYQGVGGQIARSFKYSRKMELSTVMAKTMKNLLVKIPAVDYVVPVPIHWLRMVQRGFNQAQIICKQMELLNINERLIWRVKHRPPQASLKGAERWTNLIDAFAAGDCKGLRILLVDDVVTSGATLEICAYVLKQAGAKWVGAITYAREYHE